MPAPGRTQALLRGVGTWPAPAGVGGSEKPPTGAGQRPHYPQGPPDVLNAFKTVLDQAPGQPHCPSPAHADQLRTGRCQGTTDFLRLDKGLLKTPLSPAISFQTPPGAKGKKLAMFGQAGAWEVCISRRSPMACPWLRRRLRTPQTGKEERVGALRTKASFPAVWRNPVHRLRGSLRGRPGPGLPGLGGDYSCVRAPDSSLQAGNAPGTESRSQGWRKSERNESK